MDKPISVGDWVQVVKPMPCCGHTTPMQGHIFQVSSFQLDIGYRCEYCGASTDGTSASGGERPVDVPRLKRIPPLEELDDVKRDEEITA